MINIIISIIIFPNSFMIMIGLYNPIGKSSPNIFPMVRTPPVRILPSTARRYGRLLLRRWQLPLDEVGHHGFQQRGAHLGTGITRDEKRSAKDEKRMNH